MVKVRGAIVLHMVRFVKENYGSEAHDRLVKALPARHASTFLGFVREASWEPAVDLEVYAATAKRILAPDDAAFHRKAGYYAGRGVREAGFEALLVDPNRLAQFIWHGLFDVGRVEVVSQNASETIARIHDFPTSRSACQRMAGAWEGLVNSRVEETACVLDGNPYCEMRVVWNERPR